MKLSGVKVYCNGRLVHALLVDEGIAVCCCGKRLRVVA